MKWKYFFLVALSLYGIAFVVACGKKGDDNPTVSSPTCPAGTAYYNNGYCYDQNGQVIGTYGGAVLASVDTGYLAETQRNNNLTVTDGSTMKTMLQKMFNVCDQNHINGGTASCDYWVNGYFAAMVQSFSNVSNSVRLTFYVQPSMNLNGFNYYYSLPSLGQIFESMLGVQQYMGYGTTRQLISFDVNQTTLSVINANKGFEVRTYGPLDTAANRTLIQLQVDSGKFLDNQFNFKLSYGGKTFANGTFLRCINSNCN